MWINADFLKYADNRGDVSIVIIIYFHYLKNLLRTARPEKAPQNSPQADWNANADPIKDILDIVDIRRNCLSFKCA